MQLLACLRFSLRWRVTFLVIFWKRVNYFKFQKTGFVFLWFLHRSFDLECLTISPISAKAHFKCVNWLNNKLDELNKTMTCYFVSNYFPREWMQKKKEFLLNLRGMPDFIQLIQSCKKVWKFTVPDQTAMNLCEANNHLFGLF